MSTRTISDYVVLQRIGGGTFGTCSKVCLRNDRSQVLAWKEIDYGQFGSAELHTLCQEVNLLRTLKHPNVVAYHSRIVDADTGRLFVLMEYCPNGDLSSLIEALAGVNRLLPHRFAPERFVRRVCHQLLDALNYCHAGSQQQRRQPVIHRDLKPANVLLSADWSAKLADFGLSRVLSSIQSLATTFVGSPMFMSPELLADEGFTTPKSDVWALGCVLHQLMALKAPFSAQSVTLLRLQIRNGCHSQLPVTAFSAGLRRVATEMLHVELARRPTAAELLARPEVRAWSADAVKPWSPFEAASDDDDSNGGGGGDCRDLQGKARLDAGHSAWELLQLQNRLADTEARLLAKEAEQQEREQRHAEATAEADARIARSEERLSGWEVRLMRLHESLCKKQRLLAQAEAKAGAAGDGAADSRTRHSMVSSSDTADSGCSQSQTTTVSGPKRRHTTAPGTTATSRRAAAAVLQNFNQLSPIVAAVATTTSPLGKYSPVQHGPKRQLKQQQQGTYQPIVAPLKQLPARRLTPRAIAKADRGD